MQHQTLKTNTVWWSILRRHPTNLHSNLFYFFYRIFIFFHLHFSRSLKIRKNLRIKSKSPDKENSFTDKEIFWLIICLFFPSYSPHLNYTGNIINTQYYRLILLMFSLPFMNHLLTFFLILPQIIISHHQLDFSA